MTEETDALNNRIRQLENQVADMQRLVQDTSDLLDIARANGLDKFLTGHGLVEYGGGVMRLDKTGQQFAAPPNSTMPTLYFVPAFFADSPGYPYAKLQGYIFSGQIVTGLFALSASNVYADINLTSQSGDTIASLGINTLTGSGGVSVRDVGNGPYTSVSTPLTLTPIPGDYSVSITPDGTQWYRSDTNKFRARINGVTENLATESYVAANAPTGFADTMLLAGM